MNRVLELSGKQFGKLTVIRRSGSLRGKSVWQCICECGMTTVVKGVNLIKGVTRSCGCIRGQNHRIHGKSNSSTYRSWSSMNTRCNNQNHQQWHNYGGRGISVCGRWRNFSNFLQDMGERPVGHSIDRINIDGNYEPANCRWATPKQQMANSRKAILLTYNGETMPLKAVARRYGIAPSTLRQRIGKGWSVVRAVTQRIQKKGGVA